ncbi:MAG TPA: Fe-S cluster-containing hydrogenase [Devosia sp.]
MSVTGSARGTLRGRLETAAPARFWQVLEEVSAEGGFSHRFSAEFPEIAERLSGAVDRRTTLKLMGAALLSAGLAGCKPSKGIAPYVDQPEFTVPGKPRFYATSLVLDGYAIGVLGETHEGRPTKLEGNPAHPGSLGGTDAIVQTAVYTLYSADRSRYVRRGGQPATWGAFQAEMAELRDTYVSRGGAGLGVLIGAETSPTLARQLDALQAEMPALAVYRHSATTPRNPAVVPVYRFDRADVIVSLDADFLAEGPGRLAHARQFSDSRRVRREAAKMSRLYALEGVPSLTGVAADVRRKIRPGALDEAVSEIAAALESGAPAGDKFIAWLVADLGAAASRAVFVPPLDASLYVEATALALNQRFGAVGDRVIYIASPEIAGAPLETLVTDAESGRLEQLVILGPDVLHTAPGDLDITGALQRLARVYHHGLHVDRTARLAHWHVPAAHDLESWSDGRAYEGSASILQPLIAPLYGGVTKHQVLAALAGDFTSSAQELVRGTWPSLNDEAWFEALKSGLIEGSAAAATAPPAATSVAPATAVDGATDAVDVVLRPDPYFSDGTHAANLFLAELPRPLTKIVWGNTAEMSPDTAARLGVAQDDVVELSANGRTVVLPVFIHPGMPEGVIAVALGFGREIEGSAPIGVNAFVLARRDGGGVLSEVTVQKLDAKEHVVTTQHHHSMEGRDIVRELPLAAFPPERNEPAQPTLYPEYENPEEAWGMSIDLNACIGCMACVAACQVENNSPVVGREEVARGHEMHWLRVDRYYAGDGDDQRTLFQPVPCMQCEDAPCEVVCPVNATVHTADGINAQVYNRCVGTRYCSQNCPYKVRRFNFFAYQDFAEDNPLSLLMNPDVSVRERGVMEKCTYCVQRTRAAQIEANITDSPITDGSVMTACQQACPSRAITFGNLKDRSSAVAREKGEPHAYALLEELNTKPRTTYLARIRNAPDSEEDDGE